MKCYYREGYGEWAKGEIGSMGIIDLLLGKE